MTDTSVRVKVREQIGGREGKSLSLFTIHPSITASPALTVTWSAGANPSHLRAKAGLHPKTFRQENSSPFYSKTGFSEYSQTIYTFSVLCLHKVLTET